MTINANTPSATNTNYRWYDEDEGSVGSSLAGAAQNIEKYSWHRRLLGLVCTRYMTGREVSTLYAYSMARRPASLTNRLRAIDWSPPTDNVIATINDVYRARVWKQHPFVLVAPIAGNFKAYLKSTQLSRFVDAVFHDTNFWDTYEWCGDDCVSLGDCLVKVHESLVEKKKVAITRVLPDEILVNEEEALYGRPRSLIQRCFEHREVLIAKYGTTPALRDSIWNAPGAYPGLYWGDMNAQDVVPFLEGWHVKGYNAITDKEDNGRHTVSVNNVVIEDDRKWEKNHFPFAHLKFSRLPTGFFAQGLVEQLLPYQSELNRYDEADWENQKRISWPRVLNPIGSQASVASLVGSSGGVINYVPVNGAEPKFIFPTATSPAAEIRRQRIKDSAYLRARISQNSAQAEKPAGLNSGTAIMAWATIDDSAHVDLGQRAEKFVTEIAELVVEVAEEIKPTVYLPGTNLQEIKWTDAEMTKDSYHMRAFPMSSLPQLPAARQQKIDNWYANGQINKSIKMRLEQVPDTDGYQDLANGGLDDIFCTLDNIIEKGSEGYSPPEPFQDLKQAIQIAQSYWLHWRSRKVIPEAHLNLLLQWIMQADELLNEGVEDVGIQAPQGAPAAPPMQTVPGQAEPQQLAV